VVVVTDKTSWQLVALTGQSSSRNDHGQLEVALALRNLSGLDLPVEILTVFHGEDGLALEGEPAWSKVVIPGHGNHDHQAVSANKHAVSFRVFVCAP
jgi:hypothetical protein